MFHVIVYTARTADGRIEQGVARVPARVDDERRRPSWAQCHACIPGFITGRYLGRA